MPQDLGAWLLARKPYRVIHGTAIICGRNGDYSTRHKIPISPWRGERGGWGDRKLSSLGLVGLENMGGAVIFLIFFL